jgi:hypothetical protein
MPTDLEVGSRQGWSDLNSNDDKVEHVYQGQYLNILLIIARGSSSSSSSNLLFTTGLFFAWSSRIPLEVIGREGWRKKERQLRKQMGSDSNPGKASTSIEDKAVVYSTKRFKRKHHTCYILMHITMGFEGGWICRSTSFTRSFGWALLCSEYWPCEEIGLCPCNVWGL